MVQTADGKDPRSIQRASAKRKLVKTDGGSCESRLVHPSRTLDLDPLKWLGTRYVPLAFTRCYIACGQLPARAMRDALHLPMQSQVFGVNLVAVRASDMSPKTAYHIVRACSCRILQCLCGTVHESWMQCAEELRMIWRGLVRAVLHGLYLACTNGRPE